MSEEFIENAKMCQFPNVPVPHFSLLLPPLDEDQGIISKPSDGASIMMPCNAISQSLWEASAVLSDSSSSRR